MLKYLWWLLPISVSAAPALNLEQIMSNPDWIARSPENPLFSNDSKQVLFQRKQEGRELRDLYVQNTAQGDAKIQDVRQQGLAETTTRWFSADGKSVVWINKGNLWLQQGNHRHALLSTGDIETVLNFLDSGTVAVQQANRILQVDLQSGALSVLADLRLDDNPDEHIASDYLSEQQRRLFGIIQKQNSRNQDRKLQQVQLSQSGASVPAPVYLGKGREIHTLAVSPNGLHLLIGTLAAERDGRADTMTHYISNDGYVKPEKVRSKVGSDKPDDEDLYLLDLKSGVLKPLDKSSLEGIADDPLLAIKQHTAAMQKLPEPKAETHRAVYVNQDSGDGPGARFNRKGDRVALMLMSYDNKDRWFVQIDVSKQKLQGLHHWRDDAWINDNDFNEFGWLGDDQSLYFTSEHTGYSQLYRVSESKITALTMGQYEIGDTQLSPDKRWIYFRANKERPGNHEVFRIAANGGPVEAISNLGGENRYQLSPDGTQILLEHSSMDTPPELYVQAAQPKAQARRLTHTVTDDFSHIPWVKPQIVQVSSHHGGGPIYARIYRDEKTQQGDAKPAVMFVHGAGYLQNVHEGWSTYFHEYMFHNLLLSQGYVVIDMDYRGSAGYGRDWRTAIYRQMGTPELDDYLDGVEYLVKEANVDRRRIGIYGGSYGGFMTFMALFKSPETFAAGAALRPVADWSNYNHGYTSNILNTPDVDPEAYTRSSPIEFAANLKHPLLICSGILDDNVFFQDSVRLVQRLIELKNPNFDLAVYPVESHGFKEPESWLDEYRRIYRLMDREVKGRH